MAPLLLMLVLAALSIAALVSVSLMASSNIGSSIYRTRVIALALVILGTGIAIVAWTYAAFDLVPKELGTQMRQAPHGDQFTFGGKQGNEFRISRERSRNAISLSSTTLVVGLGSGSAMPPMQVAIVQNGRFMGAVNLDDPLDETTFIVFGEERVYLYTWQQIRGLYWSRID